MKEALVRTWNFNKRKNFVAARNGVDGAKMNNDRLIKWL
jgi:hypothetical protein